MGKRHQKAGSNKDEKRRRLENAQKWKETTGGDPTRTELKKENPIFDAYYRAQNFLSGEEFRTFIAHLQDNLPACFRLNANYVFVEQLRKELMDYVGTKIPASDTTAEIDAISPLGWCPNAYKMGIDRRAIRRLNVDKIAALHEWMKKNTENGNITRQEAVSMVPPLALDVHPHHKCLDMCAAPGSKTSQLLEVISRSAGSSDDHQGIVVANDADTDRAYMLVHQCRRINSSQLMITTHNGQNFPRVSGFDRVLCDVPCSGDGTLRKNPAIWSKWTTNSAFTLHPLQLIIAKRGAQLVETGGLMVYSTCSMSPIEDEAVVAELLRTFEGRLELVDARQFLPTFKARPGLSRWNVLDDSCVRKIKGNRDQEFVVRSSTTLQTSEETAAAVHKSDAVETAFDAGPSHTDPNIDACLKLGMQYFESFDDVPQRLQQRIHRSCFSPTSEEASWMHLERCLRCVPHDEDTGGFFVATLRKLPSAKEKEKASSSGTCAVSVEEEIVVEGGPDKSKMDWICPACSCQNFAARKVCFKCHIDKPDNCEHRPDLRSKGSIDFHPWDIETFHFVKGFYGFSETLTSDSLYVRDDFNDMKSGKKGEGKSKSVYFIPAAVRRLIGGDNNRLKIVAAGVKVLERKKTGPTESECDYRLVHEGIPYIVNHIEKRKLYVTCQDFCNLLGGGLVSCHTLSNSMLVGLTAMTSGTFIAVYEYHSSDRLAPSPEMTNSAEVIEAPSFLVEEGHRFYAVCWRGKTRSVNVMLSGSEIESTKHQLKALGVLRDKLKAPRVEGASNEDEVLVNDEKHVEIDTAEETDDNEDAEDMMLIEETDQGDS